MVKIIYDWLSGKKSNNRTMPVECREKVDDLIKRDIESIIILRDIKDILKENQGVLLRMVNKNN